MESVWSVSKLSTESVGSRRQLVANCVHTADRPTRQNSFVAWASEVCTGLKALTDFKRVNRITCPAVRLSVPFPYELLIQLDKKAVISQI